MTIELNNNIYTDGGNDTETTPVVLVHGFPVDHRMWDECAAALRDQAVKQGVKPFAIWAPDMPGAGEGPIPSDEDSGGKDADGAFPYGLDRMADAYVGLLHAAGYGNRCYKLHTAESADRPRRSSCPEPSSSHEQRPRQCHPHK